MKKSIFLIGVFFVISIFVNCVYGYTVSSKGYLTFENFDDFYNYLESKSVKLDKSIDKDNITNKTNIILNSEEFSQYSSAYPYHFRCGEKIYMYKEKPTLKITNALDTLRSVPFALIFEKTNVYSKVLYLNKDGSIIVEGYTTSSGSMTTLEIFDIKGSFYSRENLDFYISGINFDFYYTDTNETIVEKNTEFSFIPTYSENYKSCNLKLDIINEPENYTLQYAINSSSSEWREFDNSVGVTVENNCLVIVRMLDENGDEIFANSYNVAILEEMLSTTYFRVNFDNSQKQILGFTPILFNNASEQFDIYFSYNSKSRNEINSGSVAFKDTNNEFTLWNNFSNSVENFLCGNGKTYYLKPNGDAEIVLTFKIVNKHTGITALTRTFKFYLTYDRPEAISSTTNGKNDGIFNTGAGGLSNENILGSNQLDIDWSVDNSTETVKTFFNTGLEFFNLIIAFLSVLPAWLTVPLYTFFMLAIVLFVIKFIRG